MLSAGLPKQARQFYQLPSLPRPGRLGRPCDAPVSLEAQSRTGLVGLDALQPGRRINGIGTGISKLMKVLARRNARPDRSQARSSTKRGVALCRLLDRPRIGSATSQSPSSNSSERPHEQRREPC